MENPIPTPEEVKDYFSKAKEVRCLALDIVVNISYASKFDYDEKTNSFTVHGGVVCVWRDGVFATIMKKKCGDGCKGCAPCKEAKAKK